MAGSMKKIRVLHVVPGLDAGGVSMILLNYYKNLDQNKISFDFAISYNYIGMTGKEFEKMGSKIFFLPKKSKGIKKYCDALKSILEDNIYDIVHVHENFNSFFALYVAKKCGVKVRISHSHSSGENGNLIIKLIAYIEKKLIKVYATDLFACGRKAGIYLYGKRSMNQNRIFVLNNAIDTTSFIFDLNKRKILRRKMGLENNFVILNVGRLSYEKNQKFLLDIYARIKQTNSNARLLIVGNGELEKELKDYAAQLNLPVEDIFLGRRNNIPEFLLISDVFVLPSFFEGLPVSGVEAITSGIPCIFSNVVTKELNLRDNIHFLPVDDHTLWINAILKYQDYRREGDSCDIMKKAGYDIKINAALLEKKYQELVGRVK